MIAVSLKMLLPYFIEIFRSDRIHQMLEVHHGIRSKFLIGFCLFCRLQCWRCYLKMVLAYNYLKLAVNPTDTESFFLDCFETASRTCHRHANIITSNPQAPSIPAASISEQSIIQILQLNDNFERSQRIKSVMANLPKKVISSPNEGQCVECTDCASLGVIMKAPGTPLPVRRFFRTTVYRKAFSSLPVAENDVL